MKAYGAEILGTFIMVFVGLATVADAVILGNQTSLASVASFWGVGLIAAILICGPISGAHFNPAITLAFAATTDFSWRKVVPYWVAQGIGSLLGAAGVYLCYRAPIAAFELSRGIERGSAESIRSAMGFGEFYPNPAALEQDPGLAQVGTGSAFLAELGGTAILAFVIFMVIRFKGGFRQLIPFIIGLTLAAIIYLFAPVSMAGFNPVRDFVPRLLSAFLGWGAVVFTVNGWGWFTVYILAPVIGAQVGAWLAYVVMRITSRA